MNFVPRDAAATTIVAAAAPDAADESDDEDAFIAVFAKGKAPKAAPIPAPRPTVPSVPLFTRLNDIKEHFPVVWHKVEDAHTRTAVYALEIFGKKAREMALSTRVAEAAFRAEMEPRLLAALRASPAWRVLRSEGREFCRLEMA
jgi:hypothetical protein